MRYTGPLDGRPAVPQEERLSQTGKGVLKVICNQTNVDISLVR